MDAEAVTSVASAWMVAEAEPAAEVPADAVAAVVADASLWLDLELPAYVDEATVVLLDPHAPDLALVES